MRIGCSEKTIGCDVARHRGEREMCQQLTARRQTIPRKMIFSKKETLSSRVLVWGEEKEPVSLWKTEVKKKKLWQQVQEDTNNWTPRRQNTTTTNALRRSACVQMVEIHSSTSIAHWNHETEFQKKKKRWACTFFFFSSSLHLINGYESTPKKKKTLTLLSNSIPITQTN